MNAYDIKIFHGPRAMTESSHMFARGVPQPGMPTIPDVDIRRQVEVIDFDQVGA